MPTTRNIREKPVSLQSLHTLQNNSDDLVHPWHVLRGYKLEEKYRHEVWTNLFKFNIYMFNNIFCKPL